MKNISDKYLVYWLRISLFITILMILVGGITRLTQSGLSIPYWKPITGIFPPMNLDDWVIEFDEYKSYPEYKKLNYNMSLNEYKKIYYWEFLHRILGRFIGVLFLFPFIYFYYKKYLNQKLINNLLFLFIMGGFQGFMGWYMVKSGLINNPHVSHYRLSIHLVLAFIIIAGIYKTQLSIIHSNKVRILKSKYFNIFINFIISLFFIQIVYGAFTAGLNAGKSWNTFPLMEGRLFPENLFIFKPIYLNFLEHDKLIQFSHRFLGLLLMIFIYIFSFQIKNINEYLNLKSRNLITIVTCQVFLGIITLISKTPIVLASAHQILAVFLLLQLINIKHFLNYEYYENI